MKNMTLANIAAACGGIYHGSEELKNIEVTEISTDSRKISKGSLFVAICGARSDGHDFIAGIYEQGAVCAVSEKELPDNPGAYIQVDSSPDAIKKIAAFYRAQLSLTVIGITGSVGKTSTKETVAGVLSQRYKVLKTLGNFNNELGLPLTIFRLTEEDEVAVLEMGISDFGEMHRLSEIARPDICIITNIGTCHLERLGDRDGVLRAKTEIFDFMNPNGTALLNGEDDKLLTIAGGERPVKFFGRSAQSDVYADHTESLGLNGTRCHIQTPQGAFEAIIPIPGEYMINNVLAGTLAGLEMGMELYEIKAGIEKMQALDGRNKIIHTGYYTVIDSCYNANPMSMKASVDLLCLAKTRKVALLGDMGELGENEAQLHYEVGRYVGESQVDILLCAGKLAREIERGFHEVKPSSYSACFDTVEELIEKLSGKLCHGDSVLVKASHFMDFTRVLNAVTVMK